MSHRLLVALAVVGLAVTGTASASDMFVNDYEGEDFTAPTDLGAVGSVGETTRGGNALITTDGFQDTGAWGETETAVSGSLTDAGAQILFLDFDLFSDVSSGSLESYRMETDLASEGETVLSVTNNFHTGDGREKQYRYSVAGEESGDWWGGIYTTALSDSAQDTAFLDETYRVGIVARQVGDDVVVDQYGPNAFSRTVYENLQLPDSFDALTTGAPRDALRGDTIFSSTADSEDFDIGHFRIAGGYTQRADFNLDGTVGADDFDVLAGNWGSDEAIHITGDATGDGSVGADDFDVLAGQWGASAASGDKAISEAQLAEMSDSLLASDGEVHLSFTGAASWRAYIGDADGNVLDGTDLLLNADGYPITDADADDVDWLAGPFSLKEIADGSYVFEGVGDNVLDADDHATNVWADLEGIAAGGDDVRLWIRAGRMGEPLQNEVLYIPEPATMGLLAFGGLGVLLRRRRS